MTYYLRHDILSINSNLINLAGGANGIASDISDVNSSIGQVNSNISNLTAVTQNGLDNMNTNLDGIYHQLDDICYKMDDLIDINRSIRDIQFFFGQKKIDLLTSIDETLKSPNQTESNEKLKLGLELLKLNKFKKAKRMFEESPDLNPLQFQSYIYLTLICLQLKEYEQALEYAEESIDFLPKKTYYDDDTKDIISYARYLAARTYEKNNNLQEALKQIEIALSWNNKKEEYHYEQARYFTLLLIGL